MSQLTPEQQAPLDYVASLDFSTPTLLLIDSVAGSGKTFLLVQIANLLSSHSGLYLAYNKSVAVEAQSRFPKSTTCTTTHALAYQATVRPLKLKLGVFNYRSIDERIKYEQKCAIVDTLRSFCLSSYTDFAEFAATQELSPLVTKLVPKYLSRMQSGEIECTHDFYLKLFHILLATDHIKYPPFDYLMLDEAGDLNPVTLEIFKLLPATLKIAVGDRYQNIYGFNHTINCFNELEGQGKLFRLTRSFRVAKSIASRVQAFCRKHFQPSFSFVGTDSVDSTINTRAFLTRTNSAMIREMIRCDSTGISYSLVRKARDIFRLPLMLCSLKYQGYIAEPHYKHLQQDVDFWYEDSATREKFRTLLSYLANLHAEDFPLQQAIKLVASHSKAVILRTYEQARLHENTSHSYILATAHSCKGAEFDEVTIADDLNKSIEKIVKQPCSGPEYLAPEDLESLNLYYVACTRAAKRLNNAIYL